jgi:hypothetical protein
VPGTIQIFEKKSVKAKDLLTFIQKHYPKEFLSSIDKLIAFDVERYEAFIQSLDSLSEAQKVWLLHIISFRRKKILEWVGKGVENNE